jgi:hypothetical protein
MANNFYTVKKTINGTEYVAQFSGISTALKAVDETYIEGTGNTSTEKMAAYLFEHIIVEPKGLKADDFASMKEFNDVIAFARGVMQGDFRDETVASEAKATSKK